MAQNQKCGFDQFREKGLTSQFDENSFNQTIREYLSNSSYAKKTNYIIPVVVHIIHQNGPENISDAQVITSINELNERLANSGTFNDPFGVDVGISLCLASVDPNGNPTTGIVRKVSSFTVLGSTQQATDLNMKNLSRWDPNLYLNIWVVKDISILYPSFAAYAFYPSNAGEGVDGIVSNYNALNSELLAHEVGHYLGLYHTFENGCPNLDCSQNGDLICDTPPDVSSNFVCPDNSCATDTDDTTGLSPFATDQIDLPNYMDYTYCSVSFTTGQSTRMNATLNTIRNTLLQSNGCGQNPGAAAPIASFTSNAPNCYSYPFVNTSSNSVGAQWDFESDGTIDATGNSVSHAFGSTGLYNVTMYAAGFGGSDTITQQVFVQAVPFQNYPMVNGFGGVVLSGTPGQFNFCPGATVQFGGVPGMASYQWSTGQTTQNLIFQPNAAFTVSLTAVDSSGLTWTSCYPITVNEVPPPQLSILGTDSVFCEGDEITLHAELGYYLTSNEWYDKNGLINGVQGTDYTVTLEDTNWFVVQQYESTGCSTISDTLFIIPDESLCEAIGIVEPEETHFDVFPNPASTSVTLRWSEMGKCRILLYDSLGKNLRAFETSKDHLDLDISSLASGLYLIQFENERKEKSVKRLMVK